MNKLNNKGQSLVMFIVFLPVFLLLMVYMIDLSIAKYDWSKINNIAKEVVSDGLKNIESNPKDKMDEIISNNDLNIKSYDINIDSENKIITIAIYKESNTIFKKILDKTYSEKCSYKGYFKDEKMIIERVL